MPSLQTVDIVVLGGTLGIFMAAALQLQGKNVAVIERGAVAGRDQEWNISRAEMQVCAFACPIARQPFAIETASFLKLGIAGQRSHFHQLSRKDNTTTLSLHG